MACNLEEEEPVYLKVMQRSRSLRKSLPLFRPPEPFRKDDSNIYIHTSLLPVRHDDGPKCTMLTLNDPADGPGPTHLLHAAVELGMFQLNNGNKIVKKNQEVPTHVLASLQNLHKFTGLSGMFQVKIGVEVRVGI